MTRAALVIAYLACCFCAMRFAPNYYTAASGIIRGWFLISAPIFVGWGFRQIHQANAFGFILLSIGLFNVFVIHALKTVDCEGN